jgi:fermentation-respiration switch protein FrsA (DUF1100 family)
MRRQRSAPCNRVPGDRRTISNCHDVSVRKTVISISLTIGGVWLLLCALAYVFQEKLIFIPGPPPSATPKSVGLEFEPVSLSAADGAQLNGWWIPAEHAHCTVIVCHGNAGSIENRLDLALLFQAFGWSTLLFDYRGYGASTGAPTVAGVELDADAAYAFAAARQPKVPIVAWGESLGGGVAAGLSTRRAVDVLVLESTFTSLADIGRGAYPFLPVRWILKADLDTRAALAHTTAAVFVLHGTRDGIVPMGHARALFEAARGRKELCEFAGEHNDRGWAADSSAVERLRQFVER